MLIVVGSIYSEQKFRTLSPLSPGTGNEASEAMTIHGGKALAQSLAAARWEVRTALVSRTGSDPSSQQVVTRVRRLGVMTSGIVESDLPTGCRIAITDQEGAKTTLHFAGANAEVSSAQVPEEILVPGNILLLQTELPAAVNLELLEKAKAGNAATMLDLSEINASIPAKKDLVLIDCLLAGEGAARLLAELYGINNHPDISSLARELAGLVNLACVIVSDNGDCLAATRQGRQWRLKAPQFGGRQAGGSIYARDCFFGTFAAGIHDRDSIPESLRKAAAASYLCTGDNPLQCMPYKEHVIELLDELQPALEG